MPRRRSDGRSPLLLIGLLIVAAAVAALGWFLYREYSRPLPVLTATPQVQPERRAGGSAPSLPWPAKGGAAVGIEGFGVVARSGDDVARPTASTAKIMTALVILENHPLTPGQPGPKIPITARDVADYREAIGRDESVVAVKAGDELTEYQLLQALLLPSGNNIATVLARWDAGSVEAFVGKLNARAAALGLTKTHFEDASGFSAKTVSSPADLVVAGQAAMAQPVFAEIVAQPQATLPTAGVVYNVNSSLGDDGNIGIKTGWTEDAGACFVSAVKQPIGGRELTVVAAVMGQDRLKEAFETTKALGRLAGTGLRPTKVLARGEVVAAYTPSWSGRLDVAAAQDVELLAWPGLPVRVDLQTELLKAPAPSGTKVGSLSVRLGSQSQRVDVVTAAALAEPGKRWRLTRVLREPPPISSLLPFGR